MQAFMLPGTDGRSHVPLRAQQERQERATRCCPLPGRLWTEARPLLAPLGAGLLQASAGSEERRARAWGVSVWEATWAGWAPWAFPREQGGATGKGHRSCPFYRSVPE